MCSAVDVMHTVGLSISSVLPTVKDLHRHKIDHITIPFKKHGVLRRVEDFAVFMVHLATIPITGTGSIPARSFGAAVIYNKEKIWDDQWIFWVGPFAGALAVAVYHQYILRAAIIKALGSFRSNPIN